ncbi:unnamed protein product [Peniophora sp. CBMAI 1063]|nr:unnamed protein product [Peniophora sp. CBMAI 1063]
MFHSNGSQQSAPSGIQKPRRDGDIATAIAACAGMRFHTPFAATDLSQREGCTDGGGRGLLVVQPIAYLHRRLGAGTRPDKCRARRCGYSSSGMVIALIETALAGVLPVVTIAEPVSAIDGINFAEDVHAGLLSVLALSSCRCQRRQTLRIASNAYPLAMIPITCNAVGDIIAVVQLIHKIVKALDDSHGAPAEYRRFIHILTALGEVMDTIYELAEKSSDENLRHIVLREVQHCCADLNEAQECVAGYEKLQEASSSSSLRARRDRVLTKLQWHLLKVSDAKTYAERLSASHVRLNGLITLLSRTSIHQQIHEQRLLAHEHTRQVLQMGEDIKAANLVALHEVSLPARQQVATQVLSLIPQERQPVSLSKRMLNKIFDACAPQASSSQREDFIARVEPLVKAGAAYAIYAALGPQWQIPALWTAVSALALQVLWMKSSPPERVAGSGDIVILTDLLGEKISVPFQVCGSFETFHRFLEGLYTSTQRLGHEYVQHGLYEIIYDAETSEVVTSATWKRHVRPNASIVMGLVVADGCDGDHDDPTATCPYCSCEMPTIMTDLTRAINCTDCERTFCLTDVFVSIAGMIPIMLTTVENGRRSLPARNGSHTRHTNRILESQIKLSGGADVELDELQIPDEIIRVRVMKVHTGDHTRHRVPVDISYETNTIIEAARAGRLPMAELDWMYIHTIADSLPSLSRFDSQEEREWGFRELRQIRDIFRRVREQYVHGFPDINGTVQGPQIMTAQSIAKMVSVLDAFFDNPSLVRTNLWDGLFDEHLVEWLPDGASRRYDALSKALKELQGITL